jgi:hypothetical protein
VQGHRQGVADQHGDDPDQRVAAVRGDPGADPGHRGEQRVRERREQPAHHQHREHPAGLTDRSLLGEGPAEVEDVLGEREARRDQPGVDDAVHDAVELASPEDQ